MNGQKRFTKIDEFYEIKFISDNTVFFNKAQETAEYWVYGYCKSLGIKLEDFSCLRDRLEAACDRGSPEIKQRKELFLRVFSLFSTMEPTYMDGRPIYDPRLVTEHYDSLSIKFRKDIEEILLLLAKAYE